MPAGNKDLPWFPWYAIDWLTDPRVRAMEPVSRGIYVDLLCFQWREGWIPGDDETVRRQCAVASNQWAPIWRELAAHFPKTGMAQRKNPKLEKIRRFQRALQRKKSAQTREAGRKSGAARRKSNNEKEMSPERAFNGRSAGVQRALNGDEQSQSQSQSQSKDLTKRDRNSEQQSLELRSSSDNPNRDGGNIPRSNEPKAIATRYVNVLDAVTGRRTRKLSPDVVRAVKARLKDGWEPWQIIAVPIFAWAQGRHHKYTPDVLLRNGEHPRTRNGQTYGGYYWLARTYENIDGTALDDRLTSIAEQLGITEKLKALGVAFAKDGA